MSSASTHAFLLKKYTLQSYYSMFVCEKSQWKEESFWDLLFFFSLYFYGSFNSIQPSRQCLILPSKKQKTPAHLGVKLKNSAPLIKLNALNHLNRATQRRRWSFFLFSSAGSARTQKCGGACGNVAGGSARSRQGRLLKGSIHAMELSETASTRGDFWFWRKIFARRSAQNEHNYLLFTKYRQGNIILSQIMLKYNGKL